MTGQTTLFERSTLKKVNSFTEVKVKAKPNTTIIVYDPSDNTYNFTSGFCAKNRTDYEEFLKRELPFKNVLLIKVVIEP